MSTRKILDKTIKDAQKVIDRARKDLEALEVTYSIGDRFTSRSGAKYLLSNDGNAGIHFVSLENGTGAGDVINSVGESHEISTKRIEKTGIFKSFVRYWDNRKKERC